MGLAPVVAFKANASGYAKTENSDCFSTFLECKSLLQY